jgi:hypothetical protein
MSSKYDPFVTRRDSLVAGRVSADMSRIVADAGGGDCRGPAMLPRSSQAAIFGRAARISKRLVTFLILVPPKVDNFGAPRLRAV